MSALPISKACGECARELPIDQFALKNAETGSRQSRCRDCVREYSKRHYEANKAPYIARAKARNSELRRKKAELAESLRARPCADCGQAFPAECMQFDHRQGRSVKGRGSPECVGSMIWSSGVSLTQLVEEIAKCDVVCANCHCLRTAKRGENPNWKMGRIGVEPMTPAFSGPCSTN